MKNFTKGLLIIGIVTVFLALLVSVNESLARVPLETTYSADRGSFTCTREEDSLYFKELRDSTSMWCNQHGGPMFLKKDAKVTLTGTVNGESVSETLSNSEGTHTITWTFDHGDCFDGDPSYSLKLNAIQYSGDNTNSIPAACGPKSVSVNGTLYIAGRVEWQESGAITTTNTREAYILANSADNSGAKPGALYTNIAWWNKDGASTATDDIEDEEPIEGSTSPEETFDPGTMLTANNAEDFLNEAVIFETMHETLIKNNYKNTIEDLTKSINSNNLDNVKVVYDPSAKKYVVGPFKIKYCEVYVHKNELQFAGITGTPTLTVYKDENAVTKNLGDGWRFRYYGDDFVTQLRNGTAEAIPSSEVTRKNTDSLGGAIPSIYNAYPHTEEMFFIEVDYEEGIHKLGGLSLDFRYLTATATYAHAEGNIEKVSYEATSGVKGSDECGEDIGTEEDPETCDNNTKATFKYTVSYEQGDIPLQKLIRCHSAVRRFSKEGIIYKDHLDAGTGGGADTALFSWDIDLTTTLAGEVWVDKDPQKDNSAVNGIKNDTVTEESPGLKNVAVTIYLYDASGNKIKEAIAHNSGGARIKWPIYTGEYGVNSGYYEVNRLEAPGSGSNYFYVVEYEYDGQVLKNTVYVGNPNSVTNGVAAQGTADTYKSSALNNESKYFKSSMAVEEVQDRYVFDQTFGEITGDSSIDSDGNTTGFTNTTDVNGNNPSKGDEIKYYEGTSSEEDANKQEADSELVISKLDSAAQNKTGSNQKVTSGSGYERYRMVASTWYNDTETYGVNVNKDNFRIKYPLMKNGQSAYVMNQTVKDGKRYIKEYMLHINLGLMGRATTDVSVLKDIYKMEIVVNEQEVVQEFNALGEEQTEYADLKILLEKSRGEGYTLGLYGSDVSYSSLQRYQNAITQVQDLKKYTELRVFVTYAVRVYNNSETNDIRINEITDYYDESYTLIDTENSSIYGYKQDGEEGSGVYASIVGEDMRREEKCVATTPYYRILSSENTACIWEPTKAQNLAADGVISSGELTWSTQSVVDGMNKSTSTTLRDLKLKVNEYAEIFTTYEIDYEGFIAMAENNDISLRESSGLLGDDKKNIAEVSNYSTFYTKLDISDSHYSAYKEGWVSGRVDKDSAPNNIDRNDLDNMARYEDDTCLAIPLSVKLETVVRDMYGYVFEDEKSDGTASGYDLTDGTTLKVGNGIYESGEKLIKNVKVSLYEVINLGEIGDTQYENLEYYYEVPEACYNNANGGLTTDIASGNGNYYISEFLAGDYVLRFDYGTTADDTGSIYTTNENGETVETNSDIIKYNGQDYENTSYLSGTEATINDKYLNLRIEDINGVKAIINIEGAPAYSVARDNESRRMVVDAYSRTIENDRAEILRDRAADDEEYVKATKMFAETPIMQVEILDPAQLKEDVYPNGEGDQTVVVKNTDTENVKVTNDGFTEHEYHIGNINFGLEKRANTDIDIEQYMNKIVLQKDGENIFSASLDEDGNVIVSDPDSAHLDKLTYMTHVQTTDETAGLYQQGFYAISIEDEYLNGLTIKITYKMKVINNSEVDFTGYLSKYYKASEIINKATYTPTTEAREDYINTLVDQNTNVLADEGVAINPTLAEILKLHGSDGNLSTLLSADMGAISTEESDNRISVRDTIRPDIIIYGTYVGRFYYENKVDEETKAYNVVNYRNDGFPDVTITYDGDQVVTTTVNQLIDYIDINTSYDLSTQGYENRSWDLSGTVDSTITDRETIPSLDALVSEYSYRSVNGVYNIYDEKDNSLVTDLSSNIVLSDGKILEKMEALSGNAENPTYPSYLDKILNEDRVEYVDNYDDVSLLNTNLNFELQPKNAKAVEGTYDEAIMYLTTTKVTASDTDANNMKFDNLVEALVYSNTTGRRDVTSVPGNAMTLATKEGIGFWKAGYNSKGAWLPVDIDEAEDWTSYPEDDQYAPEYVTIIAPTGIVLRDYVKNVVVPITVLSIMMILMVAIFGVKQYRIIKRKKEF